MQSTGEKQQLTSTNKMVDENLIKRLENFKASMDFKGKYFDGDRQAEKYEGFGTEKPPKTVNDADQTNLEARCLTNFMPLVSFDTP